MKKINMAFLIVSIFDWTLFVFCAYGISSYWLSVVTLILAICVTGLFLITTPKAIKIIGKVEKQQIEGNKDEIFVEYEVIDTSWTDCYKRAEEIRFEKMVKELEK